MMDCRSLFVFHLFGYLVRIKHHSKDKLFSDRIGKRFELFGYWFIALKESI